MRPGGYPLFRRSPTAFAIGTQGDLFDFESRRERRHLQPPSDDTNPTKETSSTWMRQEDCVR
jgi:hypothetical protein